MKHLISTFWPAALGLMAGALACAAHADELPKVTIVAVDGQASESGKAATFLVTREAAAIEKSLTVFFQLSGSAASGVDYTNPGPSVTFIPQSPFASITIKPSADSLVEGTETVVATLTPTPGQYTLGDEKSAQATITDVPSAGRVNPGSQGIGPTPLPPTTIDPSRNLPPPDRTGSLVVTITFDGAGNWKHPKNGAYSNLKFHRVLTYTVPLRGTYSAGSFFTDIDRREPKGAFTIPNFKRYLVLQPRDQMGPAGRACGEGTSEFIDESSGMEVGDPGQPPLVPFTQTIRGGGRFPSGDKTVTERDLCLTKVSLDYDKHVFHMSLDGADSFVKVVTTHNGHVSPAITLPVAGYNSGAQGKLTWFDVPMPDGKNGIEGSRVIENFNTVSGPMSSMFPLRATVKWQVKLN